MKKIIFSLLFGFMLFGCSKGGKIPTEILFLNKLDGVPTNVDYELSESNSNKIIVSGYGSGIRRDLKKGNYTVKVSGHGWTYPYLVEVTSQGEAVKKEIILSVGILDFKYLDLKAFEFYDNIINIDLIALTQSGKILIKSYDNGNSRDPLKEGFYQVVIQYYGNDKVIDEFKIDLELKSGHIYRLKDLIDN